LITASEIMWHVAAAVATALRPVASAAARAAPCHRWASSAAGAAAPADAASRMSSLLRDRLGASHVEVQDVSGGCGSFYTVLVVSPRFEGLSVIKQHR
jgi:hypothetical protein